MTLKDHDHYLGLALQEARKSPPKPTNFCVGAVLISSEGKILSTGYTLEIPGNTHAEQCALTKFVRGSRVEDEEKRPEGVILNELLDPEVGAVLYTTMEPCSVRLSGNESCVARIIATRSPDPSRGIRKVVFGAKEPEDFVKESRSCAMLDEAKVEWEYARDGKLEMEILQVAKAGHGTKLEERPADIQPNPKKRMMEL